MVFEDRISRFAGRLFLGAGLAGSVAAAVVSLAHPAAAAAAAASVGSALSSVTCALTGTSACVTGTNTSSGTGVAGSSSTGNGVSGTGGHNGVLGYSTNGDGVYGYVSGAGKYGVAGNSANYPGVYGNSAHNYGVLGTSSGDDNFGFGVAGRSNIGEGVDGSTQSGIGVSGYGNTGDGVDGESESGDAVYGFTSGNGHGVSGFSLNGTGGEFQGGTYGLIGRGGNYPLMLSTLSGTQLLKVDSAGNLYVHGGYHNFLRTAGGATLTAFTSTTTLPTVEDTGSAQLVNGSAVIRLEPAFAASIDPLPGYRVFVTPTGDTRGLFVASKTASNFVVREAQGGRTSVSFDYRIVATAFGGAGRRIGLANPADLVATPLVRAHAKHARPKPTP